MQYYQHYKGNYYRLIGEAKHSESLEPMIVYQALYGDMHLWVRPKEMFLENVTLPNGHSVPRFRPCPEEEALEALKACKAAEEKANQQFNDLLDSLFNIFQQKEYTSEDFFGGCALCGNANDFVLDIIDSKVREAIPDIDQQKLNKLSSDLYSALHHRFEALES